MYVVLQRRHSIRLLNITWERDEYVSTLKTVELSELLAYAALSYESDSIQGMVIFEVSQRSYVVTLNLFAFLQHFTINSTTQRKTMGRSTLRLRPFDSGVLIARLREDVLCSSQSAAAERNQQVRDALYPIRMSVNQT